MLTVFLWSNDVVREVHEDPVAAYVWVFGRVDSSEVLVLKDDRVVHRGQWGKGEGALEVLTSRGMV